MFFQEINPFNPINQQAALVEEIHQNVRRCMDTRLSLQERGQAWSKALVSSIERDEVKLRLGQSLRPVEYHEPIVNKSFVDDRILNSFSPNLKILVDQGQTNSEAAFAIIEYFLRSGYHQLNEEQIAYLAKAFPKQNPDLPFKNYQASLDHSQRDLAIPGKTNEESWVIKREIMDLLEITSLIKGAYLKNAIGSTIDISQLIRIAADTLRRVHQADSRLGVAKLIDMDKKRLSSGEYPLFRNLKGEVGTQLLRRLDILVPMILSPGARNFSRDLGGIFKVPEDVKVVGAENIPSNGPIIVAFSHFDRWKDPKAPPNWEKIKTIAAIQQKRPANNTLFLAGYINYFRETAPSYFKQATGKLIDYIVRKMDDLYGIKVLEVNGSELDTTSDFIKQAISALQQGGALMLSPEALSSSEVLQPKRGIGMIARMTGAPVLGVAYRENILGHGRFAHEAIFTQPRLYDVNSLPGRGFKEKDQNFADALMSDIAQQVPENQRGIYR